MKFAYLIVFLTALAYFPITQAGYIWDDDKYLSENALVKPEAKFKEIWTSTRTPQYYPMVFTSFALEYKIWKDNPLGYHLVNLAIHIANSILLALVLKALGIEIYWFIALIFAIHPIQVESVAWITQRKNVLSLFFFLSSLTYYLKFHDSKLENNENKKLYYLSFLLFVLALLSKTTACSLPVIILLILHYKNRSIKFDEFFQMIPFLGTGLILGLNTAWIEKTRVGAVGKEFDFSFLQRILIASKSSLFYIQKALLPYPLMFNYPKWQIQNAKIIDFWPLLLILLIATIIFVCWKKGIRAPLYLSAAYLANLFPALGFFSVYPFRFSFVADHFSYLAMTTLFTSVCLLAYQIINNETAQKVLACTIPLVLMALTWQQTKIYKSDDTIWKDTLVKNPCSAISRNNLSGHFLKERNTQLAMQELDVAIKCDPQNYKAITNRGSIFLFEKQYEKAIESLNLALNINNEQPTAYCFRGMANYFLNKHQEALVDLNKALSIRPAYPMALGYRGMTNIKLGATSDVICKDLTTACLLGKCNFMGLPEAKICK